MRTTSPPHSGHFTPAFSKYGFVLRAKGILPTADGRWLHFDFVPEEFNVRYGAADYTGRMAVIGSGLREHEIRELFGI